MFLEFATRIDDRIKATYINTKMVKQITEDSPGYGLREATCRAYFTDGSHTLLLCPAKEAVRRISEAEAGLDTENGQAAS